MHVRVLVESDAAEFQAIRLRGLANAPTAFASSCEEEQAAPLAEMDRSLRQAESGHIVGSFSEGSNATRCLSHAARERQATCVWPAVRGTFSPARKSRPAAGARWARKPGLTLGE